MNPVDNISLPETRPLEPLSASLYHLLRNQVLLLAGLVGLSILLVFTEGLSLGIILFILGSSAAMSGSLVGASLTGLVPLGLADLSPETRLLAASLALVLTMGLRGGCEYLLQIVSVRLRLRVETEIQMSVFQQWHDLQLDYLQRSRIGELLNLPSQFAMQIGQLVLSLANALSALVILGVYVLLALLVSWQFTLISAVLLGGLSFGLRPLLMSRIRHASTKSVTAIRSLRVMAHEHLAGMKVIHLFRREAWSQERYRQQLNEYTTQAYRAGQLSALTKPLLGITLAVLLGGLMIFSALWMPGSIEERLRALTLFLVITFRLVGPVNDLNHFQSTLMQHRPLITSVREFLRRDNKPYLQNGAIRIEHLCQAIRLEDVTFQYLPTEPPVLVDVNLEIPKGKLVAVVGASGAGKSTLVNLLTRLYDCTCGRICVDGIDLRQLDLESWRSRVAVVNQEIFLFHDSALANLRFARLEASDEQVRQAARLAQADEFIENLPRGYHTNLHERGVRLSGGQQQRLTIARALLVEADLLILDEATSDLDSHTEQAFQRALQSYRAGRTILVIAHRLATVRHADQIYVLEAGRIVEQGTHTELIQKEGAYWRLVQAQNIDSSDL